MWRSFRDRTVSWFASKYEAETSEEIPFTRVENRGTGKPVAKAKPRPTPTLILSLVSIPHRERKWTDAEPGKFSPGCFEVSKFMTKLFRHDDTDIEKMMEL